MDGLKCFEHTVVAFDLTERLQTSVIVMSDLDLGMNNHMTPPLEWDDSRVYDRGKVLTAEDLEQMEEFGRYLDVDGDGVLSHDTRYAPDKGILFYPWNFP